MRMKHREYIFLGILSTSCLLFLFGNSIVPTTSAQGSNSNKAIFDMTLYNKSYPITYNMSGGKIDNMTGDEEENSTLVIDLVTNDNGNLTLELPRNIMDSKD